MQKSNLFIFPNTESFGIEAHDPPDKNEIPAKFLLFLDTIAKFERFTTWLQPLFQFTLLQASEIMKTENITRDRLKRGIHGQNLKTEWKVEKYFFEKKNHPIHSCTIYTQFYVCTPKWK